MSWVGLRDGTDAVMQPSGLGRINTGHRPDPDEVLAQGSLVIEFRHDLSDRPVNILRYTRRDPTAAVVTLRSDPDGTLSLLMRQGEKDALYCLHLPTLLQFEPVIVHYIWDNLRGVGVFAACLPERELYQVCELANPLPLSWRDATQIMADRGRCQTHDGMTSAAIADHIVPIGPQPGIDGAGLISTPGGTRRLQDLRNGDMIVAADGYPAQVRWIGRSELLTRGLGAPLRMRSPYFGVSTDLMLSGGAILRLEGTEVEYLFGEPEVAVAVRHLVDGRSIIAQTPKPGQAQNEGSQPPVREYYQLVLDRAVPLRVSGVVIETLETYDILQSPALHRWSILAETPTELLPRGQAAACLRLRDYEAQTLRQMQAA
ncbi:Hint domain-containing protein [Flavimaricola marinus]|uniref:Hedgehog/Intein (Hint) domain-containing protein n=1 Tax=Flavimaricola marinus TaxID=1819565 RepID=A0A238LFC4_9RHOB|nr:Hint domain-containing protein [Flavimaricola marinus]SMY08125.1 hypothetical protein LOM8899_02274 [Flavimaricola marinus]